MHTPIDPVGSEEQGYGMSVAPSFSGEILMRRWSDSSTQGVQVTFALSDATELEPLKAKTGKRFMCVLVELGDDETPATHEPPKPKRSDVRGPKCREACDYCVDPKFHAWVTYMQGVPCDEAMAKDFIRQMSGCISSRKELDTDFEAGEMFIARVRVPFMKWHRSLGVQLGVTT